MPKYLERLQVNSKPFSNILAGLSSSFSSFSQKYCLVCLEAYFFSYFVISCPIDSYPLLAFRTALSALKSRQCDSAQFSCPLKSFLKQVAKSFNSCICFSILLEMSCLRISLESRFCLGIGGYVTDVLQRRGDREGSQVLWAIDAFLESSTDCYNSTLEVLFDFLLFFSMKFRWRQSFSLSLFELLPQPLLETLRLCVELIGKGQVCLTGLLWALWPTGSVILKREEVLNSYTRFGDSSEKVGALVKGIRSAKLFAQDLLILTNKFTNYKKDFKGWKL